MRQLDNALTALHAHKDIWTAYGIGKRVAILDEIRENMLVLAERWVTASLQAKGIAGNRTGEAEEWLFLAVTLRSLRLLRQSLLEIQKDGRPYIAGPIAQGANDQVVATVFPRNRWERLLFRGITGEVWMEPGVTAEAMLQTQAHVYQDNQQAGKVALVLGAGNASMLPVMDTLHKLFIEDQVVVLKPNPVNAYLGPFMEDAFAPLVRQGFLRVVYGGAEEGAYLCHHPAVDTIHMTGSAKTFEAITFGSGMADEQGKTQRPPLLAKPFTCELGNISPVIIVPGPWTAAEVQDQAEQIVTWFVANAGFGCLTPRVIIQQKEWALRTHLNEAIEKILAGVATRPAYYPGANELHAAFMAEHPDARQMGQVGNGCLPWTFVTDVNPAQKDDICFTREAFCSIFAETALEATSAPAFIEQAVEFANTTLWGNLNVTLIVHPLSLKDPHIAAAVEQAIVALRYGTVLVNMGAFAGYYLLVTPWGGFPGNSIDDIQSGTGKTANLLMFERPQKSVIRGPFHKAFDALRVTARPYAQFCRKLAYFEASPSLGRMLSLMWTALYRTQEHGEGGTW